MKIFLYNELHNEIVPFNEENGAKGYDIIILKDENEGKIKLDNVFCDYEVSFFQSDYEFLIKKVGEKNVQEDVINIYTPFLLLRYLYDKYGKMFALKFSEDIFYFERGNIKKDNTSFLIEHKLFEELQKKYSIFLIG